MEVARLGITGEMTFVHRDANGNIKQLFNHNKVGKFLLHAFGLDLKIPGLLGEYRDEMVVKNLVTTAGKALASALLGAVGTPAAVTYLEVGTGTTAADAANTALETAITDSGLARAAATVTQVTTTTANDTLQLLKSWSVTGTKAVTECGAFNASSAGSMLGRQVFSAINVVNTDTLQITYKFAIA